MNRVCLISLLCLIALLSTGCALTSSSNNAPPSSSALVLSAPTLPGGIAQNSYSASVSATGGSQPYSWSVSAGSLPTGLSLNSSTGAITGTPTAVGTFNFTVLVKDSSSTQQAASASASIVVVGQLQIVTSTLPTPQIGVSYSAAVTISGGMAPYTWSVSSGSLPPGLTLNSSTGMISGTPTTAGPYTFAIQVTDPPAIPQTASQSYSVTVSNPGSALQITTSSLPNGQVQSSYSATLSATGGTAPYSWSVTSGALPNGLSLNASTGVISGIPTASGSFTFTVQAKDSSATPQTASKAYSVTIAAATSLLQITTSSLPGGVVQIAYSATLAAAGGTPPYNWTISSGTLPAGLSLNASSGVISGTPTASGQTNFAVQVADSASPAATVSQSFSITITTAITLDAFGGRTDITCAGTVNGFTTQKINGRWWLCTPVNSGNPASHAYFFQAVGGTSPVPSNTLSKYGSLTNWGKWQQARIKGWNFNGFGELSDGNVYAAINSNVTVPFNQTVNLSQYATTNLNGYATRPVKNYMWGVNGYFTAYTGAGCIDAFDPQFAPYTLAYNAHDTVFAGYVSSGKLIGAMLDDTDFVCGMGGTPAFDTIPAGHLKGHVGFITLITSPVQTFNNGQGNGGTFGSTAIGYTDTGVYSKTAMANPPATCSLQTPCSLRDYLAKKYATIAALNTAWGSNYTTFDSAGAAHNGFVCGTGDGATKAFSCTLPNVPVSPLSLSISVGGKLQGGDCPWFQPACQISGQSRPYTCASAGQCQGTISGPAGTTLVVGIQPWAQDMQLSSADCGGCGLPQASYWFRMTWHGCVSTPSREIGNTFSSGSPQITITANNGTAPPACATGVDFYVSCRAMSGSASHGCAAAGSPQPVETLQASNIPLNTGSWTEPVSGLVNGSAMPAPPSYIDYGKGSVTLTFSTAPAGGAQITLNSISGGWMFGSGLMDEDGRHTAWVGTNSICLTLRQGSAPGSESWACDGTIEPLANANQNLAADLDDWQSQYAGQYFSTLRTAIKTNYPNLLYFGPDTLGDWGIPARKQILQAASHYVDVLFTQWLGNLPDPTTGAAQLTYMTQWFGDRPIMNFMTLEANPDSAWAAYPNCCSNLTTQPARGQQWYTTISDMLNTTGANGSYQWVGIVWWGLYDYPNEFANWGLVSSAADNAYDAHEAATGTVSCSGVLSSFTCGNEPAPGGSAVRPFGDLITGVRAANALWLTVH